MMSAPARRSAGVHDVRRRVSRRTVVRTLAFALVAAAVGVGLSPVAAPLVDWGMDGSLTPGDWEPGKWLAGTFISFIFLAVAATPYLLILVVALPFGVDLRGWRTTGRCPSCVCRIDSAVARCAVCDAAPPRRPRRWDRRSLARTTSAVVAAILVALVLALPVACGIAWTQLEAEEDAFGLRAEAAMRGGATSHEEKARHGGILRWSAEHGYGSHRD